MQARPSRSHRSHASRALALALLLAGTGRALPQVAPASTPASSEQPPIRAARLSSVQGNVSVSQIDNTATTEAQFNQPITAGTRISTADNGQAEIEFEDGSVVRLAPGTTVALSRLSSDGQIFDTDIALLHGLVYAELRAGAGYLYRLLVGADRITPLTNATVRVQLDGALPLVADLDGAVRVEHPAAAGSHLDLHAGESLQDDPTDSSHYLLAETVDHNSWDSWNEARDQAAADSAAKQTAARDGFAGAQGYGWSDLDSNGSWYDVPGQGPIWQPEIAATSATFDPYGSGNWIWSNPGGYIFASSYSWGWTPFRCGTWSYWNTFGWGWVPDNGCGLLGFGAYPSPGIGPYGGGILLYPINIHHGPSGYRPIPPPHPDPHRPHPIVAAHPAEPPVSPAHGPLNGPAHSFMTVSGVTVRPLPPVASSYTSRGGSALGASLRRDFPIDQITRRPVLGIAPTAIPTAPTAIAIGQGWQSVPARLNTPSSIQGDFRPVPTALHPYPSALSNPVYANPIHPNPVYARPGFTRYGTLDGNRPIPPNSYPGAYPAPSRPFAPTYTPRPTTPVAPIRSAPPPTITRPTPHR